jgi:hypothetical protein
MTEDEGRKGIDAERKGEGQTDAEGDSKPKTSSPQTWSADHGGGVSPPTSKPVNSSDKAE